MKRAQAPYRITAVMAAGLALGGCPVQPEQQAQTELTLAIADGNTQSAPSGGTLPADLVVVYSAGESTFGSNVSVFWTVESGGGTVGSGTTITDSRGRATNRWTLGPDVGAQTVKATVGAKSVTFSATATPNLPHLEIVAGNNQSGTAGAALSVDPAVQYKDANGQPLARATFLHWYVTAGGGTLTGGGSTVNAITDGQGRASIGWTLGAAGTQTLVASPDSVRSPLAVTFTATAAAAPTPTYHIVIVSGNNQSGTAGTPLGQPLQVRILDQSNNPPATARPVRWTIQSGGGSVGAPATNSDGQGATSNTWTLGGAVGAQTVIASPSESPTDPGAVTFTATAAAAPVAPSCAGTGTTHGGTVNSAETWTAAAGPHHVPSSMTVMAQLTIEPNTAVCFGSMAKIYFMYGGRLVAGAASQPLTYFQGEPRPGNQGNVQWDGLQFEDAIEGTVTSTLTRVVFDHPSHGIETSPRHIVRISQSSFVGSQHTAVSLWAPGSQLLQSTVSDGQDPAVPSVELGSNPVVNANVAGILFEARVLRSAGPAVWVWYPNVTMRTCEIANSGGAGIVVRRSVTQVTVLQCNLVANQRYAVENLGALAVTANDVWWGQAGGPAAGLANGVSANVTVTNPRSTAVSIP